MRIGNLGVFPSTVADSPTCGPNPCGLWDDLGSGWQQSPTDPCSLFMQCAAPTDSSTIAMTKGMTAGMADVVGQAAGAVVGGAASGLTSGIGSGLANSTTLTGWLLLAGLAIGGILILKEAL